jgi:hypothetical protein
MHVTIQVQKPIDHLMQWTRLTHNKSLTQSS